MTALAASKALSGRRGSWLVVAVCAIAFVLFPGSSSFPAGLLASWIPRGVLAGLIAGLTGIVAGRREAIRVAFTGSFLGALCLLPLARGVSTWSWLVFALLAAAVVALAMRLLRERLGRTIAVTLALGVVTGCYAWTLGLAGGPYAEAWNERRVVYSRPVVPETYSFDGEIYLRTLALMKEGRPFYPSFQQAWQEDARFAGRIRSALGFREPALFEMWRWLPGATPFALLGWFLAFTVLVAIVGWFFAATFVDDGVALLAPIALLSYFAFFVLASLSWFTFAEPWSAGAVLLALASLVRRRWLASALALAAAVAMRELAIVFLPAWIVAYALSRGERRRTVAVAVAIAGCLLPIALHVMRAPASGEAGLSLQTWLHSTGIGRLLRALRHGTEFMPYGNWIAVLATLAAVGGALALPGRRERWTLVTALVVPLAFLTAVSASRYDFYWSAILVPSLLASVPLVFARALPAERAP